MERGLAWIGEGDTGLSSETMCLYFLTGEAPQRLHGFYGPCSPLDPSDLGRCIRLLAIIPEWKQRLHELARLSPEWAGLVSGWDELETLYLAELPDGTAPRCYALMKQLRGEALAVPVGEKP